MDIIDSLAQVIVALFCTPSSNSRSLSLGLAGACWNELQNAIYIDSWSVTNDSARSQLEYIKLNLSPTLFLLHPNIVSNSSLLSLVLENMDGVKNFYSYKTLKTSMWNDRLALSLINSQLKIIKKDTIRKYQSALDSQFQISSMIDMDDTHAVQCLGALLLHLRSEVYNLDNSPISICDIGPFPPDCFMRIDSNTFKALQIFNEDIHPNWIKGKGRSKEGFSLFGLFDRTSSPLGRRKLREWMARPYNLKAAIDERQRGVKIFADEVNYEVSQVISKLLKRISDIPKLLMRIKKVESTAADWCRFRESLIHSIRILDNVQQWIGGNRVKDPDGAFYLGELISRVDEGTIRELVEDMNNLINFEASDQQHEIIVREGFDQSLDRKRDLYESLELTLVRAAQKVLEKTPVVTKLSVEYVPQLGFFVVVNAENWNLLLGSKLILANDTPNYSSAEPSNGTAEGKLQAKGRYFILSFTRDNLFFLKHEIVLRLDEEIGDIKSDIQDLQRLFTIQLEERILDQEAEIVCLSNMLATLDALISLGTIAIQYNLTQPEIVSDVVLIAKGARHLLQELTVDNFIENDIFSTSNKCVSLISGPNCSGKSIYLKQVGLIAYLAHIGSWVPAEKAIVGVSDYLLTRISSDESISCPKSVFTIDLNQISKMLKFSTSRSICLLDEFGKGTSPVDGMALLAATLNNLASRGSRVFCVLHLTEILDQNLLFSQTTAVSNFFRMETIRDDVSLRVPGAASVSVVSTDEFDDSGEEMNIIPLFKLKLGVDVSSEGIYCAKKMNLPGDVLERAAEVKASILDKVLLQSVPRSTRTLVRSSDCSALSTLLSSSGDSESVNEALHILLS